MTIVYCITHLETGRYYIGKTEQTLSERWADHRYGRGSKQTHMARALNKYGPPAFSIEEIARTEEWEDGNNLERLWIVLTRSHDLGIGFNMTMGGEGGDTRQGRPHTEETKEKIRASLTGRIRTPEQVMNISRGRTGCRDSLETRQKKSLSRKGDKNPNFGKKHSPETRAKIKQAHANRRARLAALATVQKMDEL